MVMVGNTQKVAVLVVIGGGAGGSDCFEWPYFGDRYDGGHYGNKDTNWI